MSVFFHLSPLLQSVLAGLATAFWSITAPYLPVVGIVISPLFLIPLFFTSFRLGLTNALIAGLTSIFILYLFSGPLAASLFVFIHFIPFMGISFLFLHTNKGGKWAYGVGNILSKTTLSFLILFEVALVFLWSQDIYWQEIVQTQLQQLISLRPELKPIIDSLMSWLPSLVGLSVISSLVANAAISQCILQKRKINLRILNYYDWNIPLYWDIIAVIGLMVWCLAKAIDIPDLLIAAKTIISFNCIPLGVIGLRICYLRLSLVPGGRIWFRMICIFSFLLVWPFVFIVLLGFIEPWYGLTQRFITDDNKEL
jgi:hypothetical protein